MLPSNATGLDDPLNLNPGQYEISLAFAGFYQTQNPDGIDLIIIKYSNSNFNITIIPP